jgi:hypothetical protein
MSRLPFSNLLRSDLEILAAWARSACVNFLFWRRSFIRSPSEVLNFWFDSADKGSGFGGGFGRIMSLRVVIAKLASTGS